MFMCTLIVYRHVCGQSRDVDYVIMSHVWYLCYYRDTFLL